MSVYAGTSGFSYPSWRGAFYPRGAKPTEFLRLYSERLPSVELNTTFTSCRRRGGSPGGCGRRRTTSASPSR